MNTILIPASFKGTLTPIRMSSMCRRFSVMASSLILGLLATSTSSAEEDAGFLLELTEPRVRISIPGLPSIPMEKHPLAETKPHARLIGTDGAGTSVSILLPESGRPTNAAGCAISILPQIVQQYGLSRDRYVAATLNPSTYAVLFIVEKSGFVQLQTFLISVADETHCIEVHASKVTRSSNDVPLWRKAFEGAVISRP